MKISSLPLITLVLALGTAACSGSDPTTAPPKDSTDPKNDPKAFYPENLPEMAEALRTEFEKQDVDPTTVRLGIISQALSSFWTSLQLGASQATYRINCASAYVGASDAVEQVAAARKMIADGYKGFAVSVTADVSRDMDGDGTPENYHVGDALNEGIQKNLSIVTYDSDSANKNERMLYIGTDNAGAGQLAGETLAELLKGRGGRVAAVAVASARDAAPAPNILTRFEGAAASLHAAGIELFSVTGPKDDLLAITRSLLQEDETVTGLIALHATPGPIVAQAVKETGNTGKVQFVGFDFTRPIQTLIQEGVIQASVVQEQYWMGYLAIHALYSMSVLGSEATQAVIAPWLSDAGPGVLYTDMNVVTAETFDQYSAYLESLGIDG